MGVTIVRRAQDLSEGERRVIAGEVVHLRTGGSKSVKSMDVDEGILFLHVETSTGDRVIGYNLFTGEVVNRVTIDQTP